MSGTNGKVPAIVLPPGFKLLLVTAPTLVAHLINWGLFGVLTVQAYIYYISFPKDHWRVKAVVALAYILEVVQTILSTHDAFRIFGIGWGNLEELDAVGLFWISIPILDSMISVLSQMVYTWRIYNLSRNFWLVIVIPAISLVQLGAGIYEGVVCLSLRGLADVPTQTYKLSIVWAGASALGEIVITCSMFYYLRKAKQATYVKRTTTLLTHVIKLTVETGFICAAVALSGLVVFILFPTTTCYQVFALCASKLISNCFVAVLNSRVHIVGGRNVYYETDLSMSVSELRAASRQSRGVTTMSFGENRTDGITVEVTRMDDMGLEMHSTGEHLDARKIDYGA
ncbi:hypothetical protein BXZ70DRAFT_1004623 [Cristinia sonorae]|uniref:DUF6534 domain-containing protein n=1 Tax=Cristinia sonorae TaxID=1940300 RepID=A0A8K0XT20_9AGAR|nr:hypothetical protein BXZ70DRAFT_1004623 [Cristinia sonorae]